MKAAFAALLLVAGKALQDGARMSGHEKHPFTKPPFRGISRQPDSVCVRD